jgi:hypothetical protein
MLSWLFEGSLGVNATLSADAASHIEELRSEILSGGQVELLGINYDIIPDSFFVTVNKGKKCMTFLALAIYHKYIKENTMYALFKRNIQMLKKMEVYHS